MGYQDSTLKIRKHMKQIRKGIFETNSSSSHSISIGKGINDTSLDGKPVIEATGGEFGWGISHHRNARTKLDYLVTALFKGCKKVSDIRTSHDFDLYVKLSKVISDHLGATLKVIPLEQVEDWQTGKLIDSFGFIDHQSDGTAHEILRSSENRIKNYLFSTNSVLMISNDNQ